MTPGFEKQAADLCAYIINTGQVPLRTVDFDDDWSPVGDAYRAELLESDLITIIEPSEENGQGGITLTVSGHVLAESSGLLARKRVPQP